MPDVCLWLGPLWLNWAFSLALTVCELRAIFFVSSQSVYKFDFIPCDDTLDNPPCELNILSGLTTVESRAKFGSKIN